ncbi:serine/threonine protein kinase [Streptomyces sp. NPDC014734]|uniref:serine/threonine protein kinase n=1 Tax=Streptomyces sp. NPDC014734 TaxID=3364886 RepID=UPI0036F640CD
MVLNGRYRLDERLGSGGFGVVWKAYDPQVQRAVAVKIGTHRSAEASLRMIQEARLNGSLPHPHVATVYDFGQADLDGEPCHYLVMELIDGEPLSSVLERGLPPLASAIEWAAQICAALAAAHDAGVVHRDIKPANVMITRTGTVKVLDFGIARELAGGARLTGEHAIIGSLPYMAPERWTDDGVDGRSDLYALGCVLMQLCTGRLPFTGEEWQELCVQHTGVEPPVPSALRPGLPGALDVLVGELLAKRPEERPESAREVEQRLRGIPGAPGTGAGAAPAAVPAVSSAPRTPAAPAVPAASAEPEASAARPVPKASAVSEESGASEAGRGGRGKRLRGKRWAAGLGAAGAVSAVGVAVWAVLPPGGGAAGDRAAGASSSSPGGGPGSDASGARSPAASAPEPSPTTTPGPTTPPTRSAGPPEPEPTDGSAAPRRTVAPRTPPLPTGWFRFTNASTRMCLTVPDDSTTAAEGLVQAECTGEVAQFWQLTKEGNSSGGGELYSVRNGNSGLCLSVDAARKEEGVVVTQYLCGDDDGLFPDQYWRFRYDAAHRAWRLISANSGRCASVREGAARREQVLQLDCGDAPWLLWRT